MYCVGAGCYVFMCTLNCVFENYLARQCLMLLCSDCRMCNGVCVCQSHLIRLYISAFLL